MKKEHISDALNFLSAIPEHSNFTPFSQCCHLPYFIRFIRNNYKIQV